jgi:ketosteroid isomerase-like protein
MASLEPLQNYISELLDVYIGKFNRGDITGAASYYHEPAVQISVEGVQVFPERQNMAQMFTSAVERLRKDGWDHSEWAGPKKIIVLDKKGLVLASCPCKRLRADGTSCEEFTATYTLRKVDQDWRIAALHHSPFGWTL